MHFIRGFQLSISFKKTPRNFIDSVRVISRLFIFSFVKTIGILFCARFVEKLFVFSFACNAKNFAIAIILFLFLQRFWTDWQKLFSNFCPIAALSACDQEKHILKNFSQLSQCLWSPNLTG